MEPLIYVMAIMGCADGGAMCSEARRVETRYATLAECQAATEAQLIANSDIDYPTIMAACQQAGARWAKADTRPRG